MPTRVPPLFVPYDSPESTELDLTEVEDSYADLECWIGPWRFTVCVVDDTWIVDLELHADWSGGVVWRAELNVDDEDYAADSGEGALAIVRTIADAGFSLEELADREADLLEFVPANHRTPAQLNMLALLERMVVVNELDEFAFQGAAPLTAGWTGTVDELVETARTIRA